MGCERSGGTKMTELMNPKTRASAASEQGRLWSDSVFAEPVRNRTRSGPLTIGVLKGEGIGPEVVDAALRVLAALESSGQVRFAVRTGGAIGAEAKDQCGTPLSAEVIDFCSRVFAKDGAILAGPGGGRFVYDLRRQFDLFCKISPLRPSEALIHDARIKPEHLRNVDMLLIRENVAGLYQGQWTESSDGNGARRAEQSFGYTEPQVRRILGVAARIAMQRRGVLSVVIKDGGVPSISNLWRDCAIEIAQATGVEHSLLNVDLAAYRLVQHPQEFDVLVAPNLFGDVLADLGGVLLGSRALSFSGNFSAAGAAVYQTNHGAAHDLAGRNQANPAGQIYSLAMLLRQSFGLMREARLIEEAVAEVWRQGLRTADLAKPGQRPLGTREMGALVAEKLIQLARQEITA
jgi:3-isopropylmalate dehydrogenase